MRKLVFVAFISLTFLSHFSVALAYENEIRNLSTAMAENIAKAGKKRIAVVDFTDLQGNITELGRFIAEEISVDFTVTAKGFEVIDRNHLNRILAEHKLSVSGIVDQKTVQKLGQIAGVDAIVTGSTTPLENSVRVVCKVIATDTARVIGAAKGDIAKTRAIGELLGKRIETGVQITTEDTPATITKAEKKVKEGNFLFELQSCELFGDTVSCFLLITNNGEDIDLLLGGARIIDESGIEYQSKFNVFEGTNHDTSVLVSGIPVKARITFNEVLRRASKLTLLEIQYYPYKSRGGYSESDWLKYKLMAPLLGGKKYLRVQFRNIPLSK
jgi:TolB-like protein